MGISSKTGVPASPGTPPQPQPGAVHGQSGMFPMFANPAGLPVKSAGSPSLLQQHAMQGLPMFAGSGAPPAKGQKGPTAPPPSPMTLPGHSALPGGRPAQPNPQMAAMLAQLQRFSR
jgi:hypothetical protein